MFGQMVQLSKKVMLRLGLCTLWADQQRSGALMLRSTTRSDGLTKRGNASVSLSTNGLFFKVAREYVWVRKEAYNTNLSVMI